MLNDVTMRLNSFGCEVTDADVWALNFIIQKVENHIKTECNIDRVPPGLYHMAVDMAAGEFLHTKKSTGDLPGFDLDGAVKQISEGDTSVTFAIGDGEKTPEKRLDELISYLINGRKGAFAAYRCIKW